MSLLSLYALLVARVASRWALVAMSPRHEAKLGAGVCAGGNCSCNGLRISICGASCCWPTLADEVLADGRIRAMLNAHAMRTPPIDARPHSPMIVTGIVSANRSTVALGRVFMNVAALSNAAIIATADRPDMAIKPVALREIELLFVMSAHVDAISKHARYAVKMGIAPRCLLSAFVSGLSVLLAPISHVFIMITLLLRLIVILIIISYFIFTLVIVSV